jgi:hypothetical protein
MQFRQCTDSSIRTSYVRDVVGMSCVTDMLVIIFKIPLRWGAFPSVRTAKAFGRCPHRPTTRRRGAGGWQSRQGAEGRCGSELRRAQRRGAAGTVVRSRIRFQLRSTSPRALAAPCSGGNGRSGACPIGSRGLRPGGATHAELARARARRGLWLSAGAALGRPARRLGPLSYGIKTGEGLSDVTKLETGTDFLRSWQNLQPSMKSDRCGLLTAKSPAEGP